MTNQIVSLSNNTLNENYDYLNFLRVRYTWLHGYNSYWKFHNFGHSYIKKALLYGNYVKITHFIEPQTIYFRKRVYFSKAEFGSRRKDSYDRARERVFQLLKCDIGRYHYKPTFWTFTFDPKLVDGVSDLKIANSYFTDFIREFKRLSGIKIKYLAVPEFHKSGNVHYHVVFFNIPFIEQDVAIFEKYPQLFEKKVFNFSMSDLWPYGYTKAILLTRVRDVSLYITKYMSKSFKPHHLAPSVFGQKLYFTSRGIFKPILTYSEVFIDNILKSANIKIVSISKFFIRKLEILIIKVHQNYGQRAKGFGVLSP